MRECGYCGKINGDHKNDCVIGKMHRFPSGRAVSNPNPRYRPRLTGAPERAPVTPPTSAESELMEFWSEHPWNWLTGKNLDGEPLIMTTDEKDDNNPVKPFPAKDYLKEYVDVLMNERIVMVDKSRQMLISTTTLLVMDWFCKFRPSRRGLVSKHKEGEAVELIRDKIRNVHERLPLWVKTALPLSKTPAIRIDYPNTGSYIRAVAQNVAVSEARGGTASIVLIDEAAFQDQFGEMMSAALPMANRIWAVTTANIGNPGARVFKRYIDEGAE